MPSEHPKYLVMWECTDSESYPDIGYSTYTNALDALEWYREVRRRYRKAVWIYEIGREVSPGDLEEHIKQRLRDA
jgi:hypothetical protein